MACVELLSDHGVISVSFSGQVQVQQRVDAFEALLALQAQTSCRRVLVDLSNAVLVNGSHVETLEHAARLAGSPVMRGMRIACLGHDALASGIESLAAMRGFFCQRFGSRAAALRWLCGNVAPGRAA